MIHSLRVDIYENQDDIAVVTHIFRARSQKGVWSILNAHMRTDVFLRSAINYKVFKDIPLRVRSSYTVK